MADTLPQQRVLLTAAYWPHSASSPRSGSRRYKRSVQKQPENAHPFPMDDVKTAMMITPLNSDQFPDHGPDCQAKHKQHGFAAADDGS